jgi:hypothetical protein
MLFLTKAAFIGRSLSNEVKRFAEANLRADGFFRLMTAERFDCPDDAEVV